MLDTSISILVLGIGIARGQYYWIVDIGCFAWHRSNPKEAESLPKLSYAMQILQCTGSDKSSLFENANYVFGTFCQQLKKISRRPRSVAWELISFVAL